MGPICSRPGHFARDCPHKGGRGKPWMQAQESQEPSDGEQQMLANLAKIFTDNAGDPDKVASACDCSVDKLQAKPPDDAMDFAKNLVRGAYKKPSAGQLSDGWSGQGM